VTRSRLVRKPITRISQVDAVSEFTLPANRIEEIRGFRIDEIEDRKMVEIEEWEVFELLPHQTHQVIKGGVRDLGVIRTEQGVSREFGTEIITRNSSRYYDQGLESMMVDEHLAQKEVQGQQFIEQGYTSFNQIEYKTQAVAAPVYTGVEIRAQARKLIKLDWLSKSDPLVQVSYTDGRGKKVIVGATEKQKNTHDPVWTRPLSVGLGNGINKNTSLRFTVYDVDDEAVLNEEDVIGYADTTLGNLWSNNRATLQLTHPTEKQNKKLLKSGSSLTLAPSLSTKTFSSFTTRTSTEEF